ncbi:MAG: hypothetical protein HRU19_23585 [Pseudobacteriovorax sp.]|nr:hypothetical protein [Pseudobacteriovorax sp.]
MIYKFLFSLKILFLLSKLAVAGHETNNGGSGVVCRDKDQVVQTVELLDFWEARVLRSASFPDNELSVESRLNAATQKFIRLTGNIGFGEKLRKKLVLLQTQKLNSLENLAIKPSADVQNRYLPKDCPVEGIASFDDTYLKLDVNQELFSKLDQLNRAGLLFHEAVYRILRHNYGHTDSLLARYMTSCSFSNEVCSELRVSTIPDSHVCRINTGSGDTVFEVIVIETGTQRWFLKKLNGHALLVQAYFDLAFACEKTNNRMKCQKFQPEFRIFPRSSEDRKRNVGFAKAFSASLGVDRLLYLDQKLVTCH